MNSQQDQIQALLADIDEVLSKPSPRLPWMASVETVHQRQVLDRIRSYLSQQEAKQLVVSENLTQSNVGQESGLQQGDREPKTPAPTDSDVRSTAGQILQAVIGEMSSLRTNLTQPLQDDIQALREQQQALTSEIKQLEQRRQDQYSLAQQQANQQQIISEFLQVLMARLQETLARDVAQALSNLEAQFLHNNLLNAGDLGSAPQLTSASATGELPLLTPAQRIEQIRLLQAQSDRDLMRLDSTLTVVFEALQRNLQTYQESLAQGLEKMHSLGQQGEAMFAALVSHLAEQLGREASSYVQSSIPVANIETATRPADTATPLGPLTQNEVAVQEFVVRQRQEQTPKNKSDLGDLGEQEKLPYPGTELSPQFTQLRHDRQELRHSVTQEHSPTPPEDDLFSVESSSTEMPSETMIAEESGEVEDLYESLFTPAVEISNQPEKSSGKRGNVSTLSLYQSPAVITPNVASAPIPKSTLTDSDNDDSLEDFLLESPNIEPNQISASTLADVDNDDSLEDFLLESPNIEPNQISASTLADVDNDDSLEDFLLESPNIEPNQIPESTLADVDNDDSLEDFLLESPNIEPNQIPESTLADVDNDDSLEDFLLESPNIEPNQISESTLADSDSDDSLEDFLVAEDSEFVAANFTENPAIADADLFGETLLELDSEPAAPTAPPQLDGPASSETLVDLSNVFGDEDANEAVQVQPPSTAPKTVSKEPRQPTALTAVTSSSEEGTEYDALADWDADLYVQASPDENLLPVEAPEEEQEQAILLDRNTLERLQADLFSLEGSDSELPQVSSSFASPEPFTFSDFSQVEAENPFIVSAEEEMTSLDDLFAEVSEMPVAAAPYSVDMETAAAEFSQGDGSNMTLEDILASLMEAEATPLNYPPRPDLNSRQVETTGQVTRSLETPGGEKKKVGLFEEGDGGQGSGGAGERGSRGVEEQQGLGEEGRFPSSISPSPLLPRSSAPHLPIFPIPSPQSPTPRNSNWYLGIDFGTTMLSAALLNRQSREVYPIYWEVEGKNLKSECFRIPAVVSLLAGKVVVRSVGELGLPLEEGGLLLQNFKHYLKVGIPYVSSAVKEGNAEGEGGSLFEPMLQSQQEDVSLAWLLHGLGALLGVLNPAGENARDLPSHAVGLEDSILAAALRQLGGVILGTPTGWSDAYRHNLREAVLGAGLVTDSSHIFVVEDAIATLLSELTPNLGEAESKIQNLNSKIAPGGTLIINSGAITTELALVDLPENLENLTYSHFTCQSFAYAGNALDQDIICQLLLKDESFGPLTLLPRGGYADVAARCQLQQRLESSPFGLELLAAAANLKVILQHQDRFNLEIGDRRWEVKRRDLESKVLVPFIQQLNREVNAMLSRAGMSPVAINQAICTGGNASWPAIARWLRQKLPNAIVIHDRNADLASVSPSISPSPKSKIGRVAWGLATLPLYPQILDRPRQQYSDYFLLWELMQAFSVTPLGISEITQALERRGINTRTCLPRILPILEGQLPPGLLPSEEDALLLSSASRGNPELAMIGAAPLFEQVGNRQYRLNQEQAKYLREYLGRLMASSQQKLEEPLSQSLVEI